MNQKISNSLQLILLDRDGVINEDSPDFVRSADQWQPIPEALDAIVMLQKNFAVAVCTNQSGIGRGYFDVATLLQMHEKMNSLIKAAGGVPVDVFFCPHKPDEGCDCRKPKPGLLQTAMAAQNHCAADTLYVGDSEKDLLAAEAIGCHASLVLTGKGRQTRLTPTGQANKWVAPNLMALAKTLTAQLSDV
jgi:D-glycero-D-manno-heptose 1,7-bisphosphate phosphatase